MFIKTFKKTIKNIRSILYTGNRYFCPICEKGARKFLSHAARPQARCPHCGSFERHRLLWVVLQEKWESGQLKKSGRLLHIAPENFLTQKLQQLYEYTSIDLDPKKAMYQMNILQLEFPDNEYDAIICNHVLEHIIDDRKAMHEMFRVMKYDGWGSIQVPMSGGKTFEDSSITDPKDCLRVFGQEDHVRIYGYDFINRLKESGFQVTVIKKSDVLTSEEDQRYSTTSEKEVVLVFKNQH